MKHLLYIFIVLTAAAVQAVEPAAENHYKQACLLRDQENFTAAIEQVGKAIALNPIDREWLAKCELLSAELYMKLGMLDAAATTSRQIQMLYAGTDYEKQAAALSIKIDQLIKQSGNQESNQ